MDEPKSLRDPSVLAERTAQIEMPHVAPLNAWVRDLREQLGPEAIVPWFDPADGGVDASILWLLEAPGPKSTTERGGSGFISCDNNDPTADVTWRTRVEAGVSRTAVVHWNVIPAYLGSDTKIRAANSADVAASGPLLADLLGLLPSLQSVILGGLAAQKLWAGHAPVGHDLVVIECPHPGPRNMNSRPEYRRLIVDAWAKAAAASPC